MSRLGLALAGCGEVTGAKHLRALVHVPEVNVLVLVDPDREKRERLGDRFRIPHRVADIDAALAVDGVQAVGVATPPTTHLSVALAAMKAGKHVWIDKPLTLSSDEATRIADAASQTRAIVMTGFHMRFHRLVRQARALIAGGALGRIESIRSTWNSPRADLGLPEWRWHRETGGGALVEIGVHHYDLWRYLLGVEVEEVSAIAANGTRDDENAVVTARLSNGVLATAMLSERTSHQIEIEIAGSLGRLRVDCLRFEGLEQLPVTMPPGSVRARLDRLAHFAGSLPAGIRSIARGGEYLDSYRVAWSHFAQAALGQPMEICPVQDGLRATRIVEAVVASRVAGRAVRVVSA
jgi:myo-inositol 2-dehydrogenase/D-chiro-inositol 1-dehydrogenase